MFKYICMASVLLILCLYVCCHPCLQLQAIACRMCVCVYVFSLFNFFVQQQKKLCLTLVRFVLINHFAPYFDVFFYF